MISKKVVQVEIPPTEPTVVEETHYVCDVCAEEFTGYDAEQDARVHHGKAHAVRKEVEAAGRRILYFMSAEDMKAWGEAYVAESSDEAETSSFCGEGWYTVSHWSRPCGRGCCSRYGVALTPIEGTLFECQGKLRATVREIRELRKVRDSLP